MWNIILLLAAVVSSFPSTLCAKEVDSNLISACTSIENAAERLACFDRLFSKDEMKLENSIGGGKWKLKANVSPMNDEKIVTLSLLAENAISGWPNKRSTPTLVIRANCSQNSAELFVVTEMSPNIENAKDMYTAIVRFGTEEPRLIDNMRKSTDGNALFFSSVATPSYIEMMKRCDRILFQFTPFNSNPVIIEFDVYGLKSQLDEYQKICEEQLRIKP